MDGGDGKMADFRAAQYVRMSTEHQQYSTHNQADKIREYAEQRGIEIVKTYADDGKSGLSIGGRASLQKLIADVEAGVADFNVILSTMSAAGADSRTLMRAPIMNTSASGQAFRSLIAPNNLRTMAHRCRPSSRA